MSLLLEWRADISGSWRGIVTLPTGIGEESNRANNTTSITVVVAPAPDLAPTISGPTTLALDQRETYTSRSPTAYATPQSGPALRASRMPFRLRDSRSAQCGKRLLGEISALSLCAPAIARLRAGDPGYYRYRG